jgi:hypothetical protein
LGEGLTTAHRKKKKKEKKEKRKKEKKKKKRSMLQNVTWDLRFGGTPWNGLGNVNSSK